MSVKSQRPLALVADNDLDSQQSIVECLDRIGFDACVVTEGNEALSLFKKHRPKLVILYTGLPGIDGTSICRSIRGMTDFSMMPIVMIGDADVDSDEIIDMAYRYGATDFIPRPRNWKLFTHRLRYLMRTNHAEQDLVRAHDYLLKALDMFPGAFTIYNAEGKLIIANKVMRDVIPTVRLGMELAEVWRESAHSGNIDMQGMTEDEWIAEQQQRIKTGEWWDINFEHGVSLRYVGNTFEDGSFFAVSLDVTQEKQHERTLVAAKQEAETAKQEAEAANRMKAQFLAGMSHEIRTPLNAIIGFSDIIRNERMGPIENRSYVDYAEDIHNSGKHLLDTLTLILDISKMEAGGEAILEDEFDAADLLSRAELKHRKGAADKGIKIKIEKPDTTMMLGDETRIARALYCLVDNAIKFSADKTDVTIGVSTSPAGIDFWVKDRGIGMARENIPQAFSIFSQLDDTSTRQFSGMGMGLAYAKTLADTHGGDILIDTELNVGTTAILRFPIDRLCTQDNSTLCLSPQSVQA